MMIRCNICGQMFTDAAFQTHTHNTNHLFECPIPRCSLSFKNKNVLGEHIRMSHQQQISQTLASCHNQHLLRCNLPNCDFGFRSAEDLEAHKRMRHFRSQQVVHPAPNSSSPLISQNTPASPSASSTMVNNPPPLPDNCIPKLPSSPVPARCPYCSTPYYTDNDYMIHELYCYGVVDSDEL